jgi:Holliday junction resolvase
MGPKFKVFSRGKPYRRGYNLEYLILIRLRKAGYVATRTPASKGGFDIMACKKGEILLISCKRSGYVPPVERQYILQLARQAGGIALYTSRKGRHWVLKYVETNQIYHLI